jgi:coproporphyrinogen III oxidase-like Fe-S oxidoreductase
MTRFADLAGEPLDMTTVQHLTEIGMVETTGPRLSTTRAGRPVLNSVISSLLPDVTARSDA